MFSRKANIIVPATKGRKEFRKLQISKSTHSTMRTSIANHIYMCAGLAVLVVLLASILFFVIRDQINQNRYVLSSATIALIRSSNDNLAGDFKLDSGTGEYVYNGAASNSKGSGLTGEKMAIAGNKFYGASLGQNPSQGQTVTDTNTGLSFNIVPLFSQMTGKNVQKHIVYPFKDGQVIYTLKDDGVREDVIVKNPTKDVTLSYKLELPKTLEARLSVDGSIGIYSSNPALYGNITFGGDKDEASVQKARVEGKKTNLVFEIPAPLIKQSEPKKLSQGNARFSLNNGVVTVHATNLLDLNYPITIDPSVVVTSAAGFNKGNDEGNVDITSGSVTRSGLTGGSVSGNWTTSSNTFSGTRSGLGSIAYNGYLYALGGWNGSADLNDVQYAPINSDGTIGTWQYTYNSGSSSSFIGGLNNPRQLFGITVFNGYIYVVGGSVGGTDTNIVEYAAINSDGTVGTWQTTTNLPVGIRGMGVSVYDNFMYVLGGYDETSYYSAVYYAPINADGSLGSWTTTSSFSIPRNELRSATYNGYIYIMGGYGGSGHLNDVQYAPINSDGSIGAWQTTSSFNSVRGSPQAFAYDGYMYILGGYDGSTMYNDVQFAPIYANGQLGIWQSSTNFTTGRFQFGAVFYKGFLYILGGANGAVLLNDIQYVGLSSPGAPGGFKATTSFSTARYGNTVLAYNGYLYSMGGMYITTQGKNQTTHYLSDVQYALINGDGSIGAWQTTSSFSNGRYLFKAFAYGGYIYILGGDGSTGSLNDVQYASINSNGSLGSWVTTSSFTTGRYSFSAAIYNGYAYIAGGYNGAYLSDVQYASVGANGVIGTWQPTISIPTTLAGLSLVAYSGHLYVLGGHNTGDYNNVYYSSINPNGSVVSWQATSNFAVARDEFAATVYHGQIYIAGGQSGSNIYNDVQYAAINTDGSLNSWVSGQSFVNSRHGFGVAAYDGYLYIAGGLGSAYYNDVQYTMINDGGPGALGSWATSSSFTSARHYHASVVSNGYIYVLGGIDSGSTAFGDVQYALICTGSNSGQGGCGSTPGTVGTWISTTSMPSAVYGLSAVVESGYIYIMGGKDSSGSVNNTVQYALICTGSNSGRSGCGGTPGTIGVWKSTSSFSTPRYLQSTIAYGGYMYVLGGYDGTNYYGDVQYAPINLDGSLGTWQPTTGFTGPRYSMPTVTYNGYMYVLGGYSGAENNTVQYALICTGSNSGQGGCGSTPGTVGTWNSTSNFFVARDGGTSFVINGYIYVVGGSIGSSSTGDVEYARILSDGSVGEWQFTTPIPQVTLGGALVEYDGYVFLTGGTDQLGTNYNSTYVAPVFSVSRTGYYSGLIDLSSTINGQKGGDTGITSVKAYGNLLSPGSIVCVSGASKSNPVFGPRTCVSGASSLNNINWSDFGRYVFYSVLLSDDSVSSFPDTTSSHGKLTQFVINFQASTDRRMRGGKTFADVSTGNTNKVPGTNIPEVQVLDTTTSYKVGQIGPGGGYIFYDAGGTKSWGRYLELAPVGWDGGTDPSVEIGCASTNIGPSATGMAIGTGGSNTASIVAANCSPATAGDQTVGGLIIAYNNNTSGYNNTGYSDWFMPSKDELNALYNYNKTLDGMKSTYYWTSTVNYIGGVDSGVYVESMFSGSQPSYTKGSSVRMRPIRAF